MNYLTYPTTVMKITQNHTEGNHKNHTDYPFDEACADSGRSAFLCPCDEMKILRIYTAGVNTVWLQSTTPVTMPVGKSRVVMMVEHPEDDDLKNLKVGQIFRRGQTVFREGKDGAAGNHFHISVGTGEMRGNGWEQNKAGAWVLTVTGACLKADEAFFVSGVNIMRSAGYGFAALPSARPAPLDNTPDSYAAPAVKSAVSKGILKGDTNGNLMLHAPVSRQDLTVILHRAGVL